MESSTKTNMTNVQKYLANILKEASEELFKEFLPKTYVPLVQKNSVGDSEFTTPGATQIFNMCNKKPNWKISTPEEVGELLLKTIKDDKKIVKEFKLSVQEQQKKPDKKEKKDQAPKVQEGGKKSKKEKKDKEDKKEEKEQKEEKEEKRNEEKKEDGNKNEGKKGKKNKKGKENKNEESKEDNKKENEEKEEEGKKKKKDKPVSKNVFIDIYLNPNWAEEKTMDILKNGIHVESEYVNRHVAVDFSSPNIAKEMHVGHLRSTILGESICRVLEFLGNKVERINHVGDWGTQFGMLIAYLESINPNYSSEPDKCGNIRDLEEFYKQAKKKFDSDAEFKKKSQLKTVDLQKGDPDARKAWQFICQISRDNFEIIYKKLDITLTEKGESFYDPLCRKIIEDLEKKGIIVVDAGAKIIRVPGFDIPMIAVKSDGGIGYDTTDIAALNYRINDLHADWLIYVVATEQSDHFKMLFKTGELCGFYKQGEVRLDHMGFGLVQGADGKKISTRKGGSAKLIDLLEEAQQRASVEIEKRNEKNPEDAKMSPEYIADASEKLGCSAVRYYDLKQLRTSGYRFDYEKMLDDKGNTAVYLFYSYARICSVYRKNNISEKDIEEMIKNDKIELKEKSEKSLVFHLLLFNDVIDEVLKGLSLNLLCDFVYGISVKFSEFYEACKISGNKSRILITELCKRIMKQCLDLLGLKPVERI